MLESCLACVQSLHALQMGGCLPGHFSIDTSLLFSVVLRVVDALYSTTSELHWVVLGTL